MRLGARVSLFNCLTFHLKFYKVGWECEILVEITNLAVFSGSIRIEHWRENGLLGNSVLQILTHSWAWKWNILMLLTYGRSNSYSSSIAKPTHMFLGVIALLQNLYLNPERIPPRLPAAKIFNVHLVYITLSSFLINSCNMANLLACFANFLIIGLW